MQDHSLVLAALAGGAIYRERVEGNVVDRGRQLLNVCGQLPITDQESALTGATILTDHLRQHGSVSDAELAGRIESFVDRPRPYLPGPSPFYSTIMSTDVWPHEEVQYAWVAPRRIMLSAPGHKSFTHDNSNQARNFESAHLPNRRTPPIEGLRQFAARIARERADPDGLDELLGPDHNGDPLIDVEGWDCPIGPVFRISYNGNHRLTALAALDAPCVLARVTWQYGPFKTSASTSRADDELIGDYRLLLHTFGVANFPDPHSVVGNFERIQSTWPCLIKDPSTAAASMSALESLCQRRWTDPVGMLPRPLFDDPDRLAATGARLRKSLRRLLAADDPAASWRTRLFGV